METLASARLIDGKGTSESNWEPYISNHVLTNHKIHDLVHASGTVHILAPHPDDEVLGCGGIMQQLSALSIPIHVWAITDGERSHRPTAYRTKEALARLRTLESERALAILSGSIRRTALHIPDGAVAKAERQLAHQLISYIHEKDTVLAPWHLDGHPDHEAVSRAGFYAARWRRCRFIEIPIWGWHWANPVKNELPLDRAVRILLSSDELKCKKLAIQQFQTQLTPDKHINHTPILPEHVLARFHRPFEVVLL